MGLSIRLLVVGCLTSLSLCSVLTAAEGRKLAVVVGVNTYRQNSGLPPLAHAASDAKNLSAALRTAGFTVFELTHEVAKEDGKEALAPNLEYIRDQISGVLDAPFLGADDAVIISLHGHGVQFEQVADDGQKTPKFYFCPANATIQGLKTANEITDRNYLLPLDELYDSLGKCSAATKLLIVDACRNDPNQPGVFRNALASATLPKLPPPLGGVAALFSCKPNQMAVEDKDLGQGVFTHFLIEGLEGKADLPLANQSADGVITFSELTTYVATNTYAYVQKKHNGLKQSPEMRGEFDLNLPLARVPQGIIGKRAGVVTVPTKQREAEKREMTGPPDEDSKPVFEPFDQGAVWSGSGHTLTVIERKGETFSARFESADWVRIVNGTVKGTQVKWLAKDVKPIKGGAGGNNTGRISNDLDGYKMEIDWRQTNGKSGKLTIRRHGGE